MSAKPKRNCYQVLGVDRRSSTETIRRAYTRLTAIFEPDNPTLYGLYDEADARALLGQIRHAYRVLTDPTTRREHDQFLYPDEVFLEDTASRVDENVATHDSVTEGTALVPMAHAPDASQSATPGRLLKSARQNTGLSLEDIAERTKIALFTLRAIESENYADLPAQVYVRAFIRQIAQIIRLDNPGLLDEYLRRFEAYTRSRHT